MTAHMTNEQRHLACRLQTSGQSLRANAGRGWRSHRGRSRDAARTESGVPSRRVDTSSSASQLAECEGFMPGPIRAIVRRPERSPFSLSREVVAMGGRQHHRISPAHQRARVCLRRPMSAELDDRRLCETVSSWFGEIRSPDEIAWRLRRDSSDDATVQRIHEAMTFASLAR